MECYLLPFPVEHRSFLRIYLDSCRCFSRVSILDGPPKAGNPGLRSSKGNPNEKPVLECQIPKWSKTTWFRAEKPIVHHINDGIQFIYSV